MLSIRLAHKKINTRITQQAKLVEVIERADESKWRRAGHVTLITSNYWITRILEYQQREIRRSVGKLYKSADLIWMRETKDKIKWEKPTSFGGPKKKRIANMNWSTRLVMLLFQGNECSKNRYRYRIQILLFLLI